LQKPVIREWIIFKYHAPAGSKVYLAGTFNNWDPTGIKLGESGKGSYSTTVLLPVGSYEYKFVVNGKWMSGPDTCEQVPNPFGSTNCKLVVGHTPEHAERLHTFVRMSANEPRLWTVPAGG
jgi:1,4-alpha-glucan branching enzyme